MLLTMQNNLFSQQVKLIGEEDYYNCNVYRIDSLVQIYQKKNQTDSVKNILERAIQCPLETSRQLKFYWQLADIYYQQGNYSGSLRLINLYDSSRFLVKTPDNPYHLASNFAFALARARCYEGMHDTDNFINVLTPFVFFKWVDFDEFYDSISYKKIYDHYLEILLNKYSVKQVKQELDKANSGFYYSDKAANDTDQFGLIEHKIDCWFMFFNNRVLYLDVSIFPKPGEKIFDYLSRDYQYNNFKDAPLFTKIKNM